MNFIDTHEIIKGHDFNKPSDLLAILKSYKYSGI